MIFSSAGHCAAKGHRNYDPGAVSSQGRIEAQEAIKVRNRVNAILRSRGYNVIEDNPTESLREYLNRIKPGPASVVVEYHFDAAVNPAATGCSTLVGDDSSRTSQAFARELAAAVGGALGIRVRDGGDGDGILFERESHRGRLGLMREAGTVCLLEVCFISNPSDIQRYDDPARFEAMCQGIANVIGKYEDLIK
jgi:N-acetylmuramoyl-L-alanine amidase